MELKKCGPGCDSYLRDIGDLYTCARAQVFENVHIRAGDSCRYDAKHPISLIGLESLGDDIFLGHIHGV
jgi:hypothetical protein